MTKPITQYQVPTNINPEAKRFMKALLQSLEDNNIQWNGLDNGMLNLIAYEFHTWVTARDILMDEGFVVRERNARNVGISKPHPAVKIKYDAASQLRLLFIEFGLTPKSRGKVDALQAELFSKSPIADLVNET